jgi:hypothetical protein
MRRGAGRAEKSRFVKKRLFRLWRLSFERMFERSGFERCRVVGGFEVELGFWLR